MTRIAHCTVLSLALCMGLGACSDPEGTGHQLPPAQTQPSGAEPARDTPTPQSAVPAESMLNVVDEDEKEQARLAAVPMAPLAADLPELRDLPWNDLLPAQLGTPDPSLERLVPLETFEGERVLFYEERWPSGALRLQGHRWTKADGRTVLHGPEWRWYANGQLELRRVYRDDRSDGPHTAWHESGYRKSVGEFKQDQVVGRWLRWNEVGKLIKLQNWSAGQHDGTEWIFFGSGTAGTVSQKTEWAAGKKTGHDWNWSKRGYPLEHSQWKNGRREGERLQWHAKGVLASQTHWVGGVSEGDWKEWWPDGTPRLSGAMEHGKRSGLWQLWTEAGILQTREGYAAGEFDGRRTAWTPAGVLAYDGEFDKGKACGRHKIYFEGGGIKSDHHFVDGVLDGPMKTWHANGQLATEGNMKNGKRDGEWTLWDDNGDRMDAWSGTYENGSLVSK